MPPTNARVNFGDIMQAVEDQLLEDGVVEDAAQIAWGTPDHVPQLSGPFDVLLIARNATNRAGEGGLGYDGGSCQLTLQRYLDVWVRKEALADPGGGLKTWIKEAFALGDQVLDSVGNDDFWPEDEDGNLLTVESIKLAGDVAPAKPRNESAFGDYVCTLSIRYFPKVDPQGP